MNNTLLRILWVKREITWKFWKYLGQNKNKKIKYQNLYDAPNTMFRKYFITSYAYIRKKRKI